MTAFIGIGIGIWIILLAIFTALLRIANAIEESNLIAADQAQFVDLNKMRKP